jgi:FtsH-binding integral membrane protein
MSNYPYQPSRPATLEYSTERSISLFQFFNRVYAWMFVGLMVTALVGIVVSNSPALFPLLGNKLLWAGLCVGAFLLSLAAQSLATRVSVPVGLTLFLTYAALLGVLLSGIFLVYDLNTLLSSFFVTAGVFGGMSFVGFVIKKDLSGIGQIAVMCLWGVLLASIANIFFASTALDWALTYAVLALFIIITAYKTQELRNLALEHAENPAYLSRIAVYGSLILYIAFINLFVSILRILGNRK